MYMNAYACVFVGTDGGYFVSMLHIEGEDSGY